MTPVFKTRYEPAAPRTFAFYTEGESKTQQQFKAECDVNTILAKYQKTGMLTHVAKHQGQYGDFASLQDYQTNLDRLISAQNSFNDLPSSIRTRFANDPGQLIAFLADEKNNEESYKLGLRVKPDPIITPQESFELALEKNDQKRAAKAVKKD